MPELQLELTNDELLSTTRAVRKRLDFDRDVPMSAITECMESAVQAPSGSNAQGWQFVFVTDKDKREKIGEFLLSILRFGCSTLTLDDFLTYDDGDASFIANVGARVEPIDAFDFEKAPFHLA